MAPIFLKSRGFKIDEAVSRKSGVIVFGFHTDKLSKDYPYFSY